MEFLEKLSPWDFDGATSAVINYINSLETKYSELGYSNFVLVVDNDHDGWECKEYTFELWGDKGLTTDD